MTRGALLAVVLVTSVAHAGPQDEARTLFDLGQKEMDAKQVDAACNSFERSLELDPQIGTRLNLADCRERQGRLVEAYQLFADSIAEAARTKKEGREKFARERATTLATRLVKVTLKVATPDLTGLSITLGDHTLARGDWAAPSYAMPGTINVLATAPGHLPFRATVTGAAGKELAIEVPSLGVVAAPPAEKPAPPPDKPAPPPDKPAPPVTSVTAEPPPETPAPSHKSRVPMIVGGVGGGLVLTSFGLGLHAKSRYDTASTNKSASGVKSAQSEADVATGFAIAGGVAIGIGIVLYLRERNDNHPTVAPVVGDHTVGLSLVGPL